VGGLLVKLYENSEGKPEDRTRELLQFLKNMEQMNEEKFGEYCRKLDTNRNEILVNRSYLKQLVSETSMILEKLDKFDPKLDIIVETTTDTNQRVKNLESEVAELITALGITTKIDPTKQIEITPEILRQIKSLEKEKEYWKSEVLSQKKELPPLDIDAELKQGNFYYYAKNYVKAI
jgi:uncharacterized protein YhaN